LIIYNSNAIVVNSADIKANSNAIVSIDARVTTNETNISTNQTNITYNSNAIVANSADIEANSNLLIAKCADIDANSAAIVSLVADVAENSAAIVADVANITYNSNAILSLVDDIAENSNAIVALDVNNDLIIYNSNAIVANSADIEANSNLLIAKCADIDANSAAIVANVANITYNSNAILSLVDDVAENSNAIVALDVNNDLIVYNSNAIVANSADIEANSNLLIAKCADIDANSAAIVANASDIADNSAAIVTNVTNIEYNSSSIVFLNDLAIANSNAAVGSGALSEENSNAIVALDVNNDLIVYNSNAIVANSADIEANSNLLIAKCAEIDANSAAIVANASDIADNSAAIVAGSGGGAGTLPTENSNAIINIFNTVIGYDLPDASGDIYIDGDIINNFTINTSLSLGLTVSGGATINVADTPVELKCTDTIYVIGRDNVIDVSNIFDVNGTISFAHGSELIFQFNDKGDERLVRFCDGTCTVTYQVLARDSRLAFREQGRVIACDGMVFTFDGTQNSDKPQFVLKRGAQFLLGADNADADDEGTVTFNGKGIIWIDQGGELHVDNDRHLIIGGDLNTCDIDILVDDEGLLSINGTDALMSIHATRCTMDFDQGGELSIGTGGKLEINALDGSASAGLLTSWIFDDGGVLNIDVGGEILLGDNSANTPISFDNTNGMIMADPIVTFDNTRGREIRHGVITLLSDTNFSGVISGQRISGVAFTAETLVSSLVQRIVAVDGQQLRLNVSTLFVDANGNDKIRLRNGAIATLVEGDIITGDNTSNGWVYGTNAGIAINFKPVTIRGVPSAVRGGGGNF